MLEDWNLFVPVLSETGAKLGIALLCGLLLGVERELKDKPAGLRTITLITVGAALFMIVSDLIGRVTASPEAITQVDPSRVASQVVTGIGFLGAGAIIQSGGSIHGLTTAATIWVAAGIGLCVGVGFPLLGICITIVVLLVLVLLNPLRKWLSRRGRAHTLRLSIPDDMLVLQRVQNTLEGNDVPDRRITVRERRDDRLILEVVYHAWGSDKRYLLDAIAAIDGVRGIPVDLEDRG